jgi:hypothetical protein
MLLDAYDLRARVAVAYLVFAPIVFFVVAFAIGSSAWWKTLGGLAVACGGPLLAAQWGRSAGRRKEPSLWASWGGSPTLQLLRFSSADGTAATEQRHASVQRATGITLPDRAAEEADPDAADAAYNQAIIVLRELTRDRKQFNLVWEENVNYGFRRNLWGHKPSGISLAGIVAVTSLTLLICDTNDVGWGSETAAIATLAFAILSVAAWAAMVTRSWVKQTADAYARRLIESAIRLPPN